jgi:hypothetical protein
MMCFEHLTTCGVYIMSPLHGLACVKFTTEAVLVMKRFGRAFLGFCVLSFGRVHLLQGVPRPVSGTESARGKPEV